MGRHCLHRHLHDKPHLRGGAHVTPFGGVLASAWRGSEADAELAHPAGEETSGGAGSDAENAEESAKSKFEQMVRDRLCGKRASGT